MDKEPLREELPPAALHIGPPVEYIAPDFDTKSHQPDRPREEGIALSLSGGGYRAMLFHLGALWRLNELGYLHKLHRISSVSGGSIVAGVLGMNWQFLDFTRSSGVAQQFKPLIVEPVRRLASITLDRSAAFPGLLWPPIANRILARAYRRELFGDRTLQDLPDEPRFIFNATNIQSGALWRFSKKFMADWRVGMVDHPKTPLSFVVAASSGFPPFLSPAQLDLRQLAVQSVKGNNLHKLPYIINAVLTDGGVYDNLGLETTWKDYKTILVSDGGQGLTPEPNPPVNWLRQTIRVLFVANAQVGALRKRQLIDSYKLKTGDPHHRNGAYWGIHSDISNYHLPPSSAYPFTAATCPEAKTATLANVCTRFKALEERRREQLINWGYAICDVSMRAHFDRALPQPQNFPYPTAGV